VDQVTARPLVAPLSGAASLTDQVVHELRESIRSGVLRPGELYSVYQLAEQLQVSRTPVREGLLRLAEAGMVRFERNRGFRVLRRAPADIAGIFHLRLLLEVPAARLAATRMDAATLAELRAELDTMHAIAAAGGDERLFIRHDRRFHDLVMGATGNDRLVATVDGLRDATITLGASTVDRKRSLADVAEEHAPVLTALVAGDGDAAAAALRGHISHTGTLLVTIAAAALGEAPAPADLELLNGLP
jgi:DNA-binding GntR family transcriptional regulator